jgi:hypothetical protein
VDICSIAFTPAASSFAASCPVPELTPTVPVTNMRMLLTGHSHSGTPVVATSQVKQAVRAVTSQFGVEPFISLEKMYV